MPRTSPTTTVAEEVRLRRSSRASLPRLNSSLVKFDEVDLDSSLSGEDERIIRPFKRRKKNSATAAVRQPQRISTTDSTPSSSPTTNPCTSIPKNSEILVTSSRMNTRYRGKGHGDGISRSLEDVTTVLTPRSGRLSRKTCSQNGLVCTEAEHCRIDRYKGNMDPDLVDDKRLLTNSSEHVLEEDSASLSAQESDADFKSTVESTKLSTDLDLENVEQISESIPDEQTWENFGETREDDDRVADEVHKRYEVAKSLRVEMEEESQKSLLEQLLDQSDKYTGYMLARSLAPQDREVEKEKGIPASAMACNRQQRAARRQHRGRDREEELLMREADEELAGHQQGFWTRLSQQPKSITGGTLKTYQLEGLNWLIHLYEGGLNGILADEMGLGKTLQTISLLAYLKESRNIVGPHLILVPKSTLGNWCNEIKRFCPSLRAFRFHGAKEERQQAKDRGELSPTKHDIFITSYELCIKEQSIFRKFNFRYIVVDEAHRIKNEASKLSKIIRTFRAQFRLLLTGTPLQNNLRELWSLLNFLFPEMFASSEEFDRIFDLTGAFDDSKNLTPEEKTMRNAEIVSRLHKILKPFLLRRIKAEVVVELPPKKEMLLYIPLSNMQRTLYKDLLARNVDAINDTGGRVRLLNLAMQLRKACNHPYLFEGYEDKTLDPFGDHLIANSGKMVLLDRLLQKLISTGSRVLIFTQMTRMLDILEDYCRMRSYSYCRLDGSTLGEERERQLEEFNAPNSPHSIFLLSTRAGGLGINLATADTVVIYDSDWNPQIDLQAMDRAHRIGQKKHVNVYRLVHEHTIEEKIIERAMLKLRLDTAVIQQGRLSDRQSQLNKTDLMRMIQFGADQIYKSSTNDVTQLTDEDIELILSRGEEKVQELSGKLENHLQQKSLLDFDFSSPANLYEFEGIDYNADRQAWAQIGVSALDEDRNAKRKVRVAQERFEEMQRHQQMFLSSAAPLPDKKAARHKYLRLPRMEEWQFYNRERILELHDVELQFIASHGMTDEPTFEERVSRGKRYLRVGRLDSLDEKMADPVGVLVSVQEEKQSLLAQGFGDWSKKDFFNFVKSCETVGAANTKMVARDVGKSDEEIERYLKTFLERYIELTDGEKWLKRVKSGDDVNLKRRQMEELISGKLALAKNPWHRLTSRFPKSKTQYTDDEDRWLLSATLVVGYGNWDQLQIAINSDPTWTFNWFMRSRTSQDLARRIEFLARQIQREVTEETATRSKIREAIALPQSSLSKETADHLYPSTTELYKSTIILPAVLPSTRRRSTGKVGETPSSGRKPRKTPTPKKGNNPPNNDGNSGKLVSKTLVGDLSSNVEELVQNMETPVATSDLIESYEGVEINMKEAEVRMQNNDC